MIPEKILLSKSSTSLIPVQSQTPFSLPPPAGKWDWQMSILDAKVYDLRTGRSHSPFCLEIHLSLVLNLWFACSICIYPMSVNLQGHPKSHISYLQNIFVAQWSLWLNFLFAFPLPPTIISAPCFSSPGLTLVEIFFMHL